MKDKYKNRWHKYQSKFFGNFGIVKGDNVLDVGCGYDTIFPLANYCIDPKITITEMKKNPLIVGKNFWQTGLLSISKDWPDKKFHFIYASHILEHVTDPDTACKELIRLGKKGYIEAPSRVSEMLFGDHTHRWHIENREGVLTFIKMTEKEMLHPFADFFYRLFHYEIEREPKTSLEKMIYKFHKIKDANPEMFYTMFKWEGSFKWQVIT